MKYSSNFYLGIAKIKKKNRIIFEYLELFEGKLGFFKKIVV